MDWSPRGDFEAVADGLEAHTLVDRDGIEYPLTKVLRRAIRTKEVWASNGRYRAGDSVFHLSTAEWATEPQLGAFLRTLEDDEFVILGVDLETLSDRWKCVGRNLIVSEALTERITILVAGDNLRTPAGALRPAMWIPEATGVMARVQPIQAERKVEHDQSIMPETGVCVFQYAREIDSTRRIQQADGTVWKITKVAKKDNLDVLMEAEIERTPWPLT
jgi:hypothetical protein